MIAKQTVYLAEDHKTPVADGSKEARFLLVRQGCEIADSIVKKYDGAAELISGESQQAPEPEQQPVEDKPSGKKGK